MITIAKVRDIVKSPVITVDGETSVSEAARLMSEKNISGIIVTVNGAPKGLLTERDIVRRVVAKNVDPAKTRVKDVMSSPLITIDVDSSLLEAVDLMNRKKVRRVVVTKGDSVRDFHSKGCGRPY